MFARALTDAPARPMIKICGVTEEAEAAALGERGVALAGLWRGTAGGARELDQPRLNRLAAASRAAGVEPCMVTLSGDPAFVADALRSSGVRLLQLHGFCLPPTIGAIRAALGEIGPQVRILKVLHVDARRCIEERLLGAYRACGIDGYIVDAFAGRDAVGSTGLQVDPSLARRIARELVPAPVWLAGGIDARRLAELAGETAFAGFDVDGAARAGGRICPSALDALLSGYGEMRDVA